MIQEKENTQKFILDQLKIEHFHWNSGFINNGSPINTSIELKCNYNTEKQEYEWKKIISHTYYNLESDKNDTDIHTEIINNSEELLSEIEKYGLRDLKNNYFTEKTPEKFSRWELTYNYHFKIVGTYDQSIPEFEKISKLLDFEKIIDEEVKKHII